MDIHATVTNPGAGGAETPNPDPAHVAVWIALNRARLSLVRQVDRALRSKGLPPLTWYDVLWSIEKRGGTARPTEIVDDLLFEPSALSHMIRRIETAGLLRVSQAKDDKRRRVLQITPEGQQARSAIWQIYGAFLTEQLVPLGQLADANAVAQALEAISVPQKD